MRAVLHDRYGPPEVLRLGEVSQPEPHDDEILVKVHAAAITRTDAGYRAAHPPIMRLFTGLRRPKRRVPGSEFAGEVVAAGVAVDRFSIGDRVFGSTSLRFGAHAEYLCVRQTALVAHMPPDVTFEAAAAVCEGALYALTTLRSAGLREGQRLLVFGASGAIGSAAVQLAKCHFGAQVTAVCSARNVAVVQSLSPDAVIDYTREDFTRSGQTFHVVHDAVGKHSFRRCRRSLESGGVYVVNDVGYLWHVPPLAVVTRWLGDKRVVFPLGRVTLQDVLLVRDLIAAGKFRPIVDRVYPLDQVVDAAAYVDTGRKTGNVVLTIEHR